MIKGYLKDLIEAEIKEDKFMPKKKEYQERQIIETGSFCYKFSP